MRELNPAQDRPQRRPAELALQAGKRLGEIDARAQVRGKLAAELGELPRAHPAEQNAFPPGRPAGRLLEVLGERVRAIRVFFGPRGLVAWRSSPPDSVETSSNCGSEPSARGFVEDSPAGRGRRGLGGSSP